MIRRASITFFFLLTAVFCLSAQKENSPWRLAIGLGGNSTKLNNKFRPFGEISKQTEDDHFGFQGNILSEYTLSGHWRFLSGLGLTQVNCDGYKYYKATFGPDRYDTLQQNYLLLDLPVFLRFQLIDKKDQLDGFNFFLDFGFSLKTAVSNQSSYTHHVELNPIFGTPSSSSEYGTLQVRPFSLYGGFGLNLGHHFAIDVNWSGVPTVAKGRSGPLYKSRMTSFALHYFI